MFLRFALCIKNFQLCTKLEKKKKKKVSGFEKLRSELVKDKDKGT